MKRLPKGLGVAEQADQSLGEIGVMGHHPQRSPVSRHDQLLSANHSIYGGVRALPAIQHERNLGVTISQRRPNDGDWESLFAVSPQQTFFASDLISRILPVAIGEGSRLCHEVVRLGLLISAGRANEDELPGASTKEAEITFNVCGSKSDPVDDGVEGFALQFPGKGRIVHVGNQGLDAGREGRGRVMLSPAEQGEVHAARGRQRG